MTGVRPYVLVVDDLRDAANSMAQLLGLWGYDADPMYSGAAALEAAHRRRPSAVLLDIAIRCGRVRANGGGVRPPRTRKGKRTTP